MCSVDGCENLILAKGLCKKHYQRNLRYGHPLAIKGRNGNIKHGMAGTPEYRAWKHMKDRCLNPNDSKYYLYGGRGICIASEWIDSFQDFYSHIGPKPDNSYSIDRIDTNGNYEPGNVRWASRKTQANNKRCNTVIEYEGEAKTLSEWAEHLELPASTLYNRINTLNWGTKKALTTPKRGRHGNN